MAKMLNTQTQPLNSDIFTLESQPIEKFVFARLYAKNNKLKSLGIRHRRRCLQISSGIYDLCNAEFKAGRLEENDECFTSKELPESILNRISKIHFKINKDVDDVHSPVYIVDMARNGTYINGEKIGFNQKRILLNDDIIAMAHPRYKVYQFKHLSANNACDFPKEITTSYHVSKDLGSGACGVVKLVYNIKTCEEYALKHVQKNKFSDPNRNCTETSDNSKNSRVMNEVLIMKSLHHPCIVKMHDIINNPDSVYMVLEYMEGGDLLSRIIKHKKLSEKTTKLYFFQICHALKYLHDKGITHRDIKPDNILLKTREENTIIKISDFGLSKLVENQSLMKTLCGTPLYIAPEVLKSRGRGSYTKKVDIWSLGVVLFTCLSGMLPFCDDYGTPAVDQIKKGEFSFKHLVWRSVSNMAQKFIVELLTVDPNIRPNIDEILNHSWLNDINMIRKAENLMKIKILDNKENNSTNTDSDNFPEPQRKKIKIEK